MADVMKDAISKVVARQDLSRGEAEAVMGKIMQGEATQSQIGAFLAALRMKGEAIDEIVGCATAMRAHASRVTCHRSDLVDTCGTGGDQSGTFNISTTTAFVVAGAGAAVAKHGNRSISSQCGSADVLEAAGVKIDLGPEQVGRCIDEVGIGFLFAQRLHPAMKHAAGPRRELGIRTIFNMLGPLTNPAFASRQLLGVFDPKLTETFAKVLMGMGSVRAFVVSGKNGMDELTTAGASRVTELRNGVLKSYELYAIDVGFSRASLQDLKGGTAQENVEIMKAVLQGQPGPRRDTVLLNSAAALVVAGKAADLKEGIAMAADVIDRGLAWKKVQELTALTQQL